jgi:hypothetical protein
MISGTAIPIIARSSAGDPCSTVLPVRGLFRDSLLIDDLDDAIPANDVPKLVDASNHPTFQTTQELKAKLISLLGLPSDVVTYDPVRDSLLINVDLSQSFDPAAFPLAFNFDLGPLLDLSTNSSIQLNASAGLTLTIGLYLGNEGAVHLDDSTLLSGLHATDSISIRGAKDMNPANGRLFPTRSSRSIATTELRLPSLLPKPPRAPTTILTTCWRISILRLPRQVCPDKFR